MDGIPHCQEAYGEDGQEDDDDIDGVDTDGIGIDYKRTLAAAQGDDAIGLLRFTARGSVSTRGP